MRNSVGEVCINGAGLLLMAQVRSKWPLGPQKLFIKSEVGYDKRFPFEKQRNDSKHFGKIETRTRVFREKKLLSTSINILFLPVTPAVLLECK